MGLARVPLRHSKIKLFQDRDPLVGNATPNLARFGIAVEGESENVRLALEDANRLYNGGFVNAATPTIITQIGGKGAVEFTLRFPFPLKEVRFRRPAIRGLRSPSGSTHPEWWATALDDNAHQLDSCHERLIEGQQGYFDLPARDFSLNSTPGSGIYAVRFKSDGRSFAAYSALLLDDLTLVGASGLIKRMRQGGFDDQRPGGVSARTIPDQPTSDDALTVTPVVVALHSLLTSRRAGLPMAIGIAGKWGSGKSSLMQMLESRLRLHTPAAYWYTVRFAAWKYERSEAMWAALAKAIFDGVQRQMNPLQAAWFRMTVLWARNNWERRVALGLSVILSLFGIAAGIGSLLSRDPLLGGGLLASMTAVFLALDRFYPGFKKAVDGYVKRAEAGSKGLTTSADKEVQSMLSTLLPPCGKTRLAVFVDDLDRCGPTAIVDVIAAINQVFNSAEFIGAADVKRQSPACSEQGNRVAFVLGLDRESVVASIEVAYQAMIESLRKTDRNRAERFGYDFLEKIIQLYVCLPKPTLEQFTAFVNYIHRQSLPTRPLVPAPPELLPDERRPDRRPVVAAAAAEGYLQQVQKAQTWAVANVLLDDDNPAVTEVLTKVLPFLERNPRQLKRLDNSFRLQAVVALEADPKHQEFSTEELIALAKLVILRMRWPRLAIALEDGCLSLETLETAADSDDLSRLEVCKEFGVDDVQTFADLLKQGEGKRLSKLKLEGFPQVA